MSCFEPAVVVVVTRHNADFETKSMPTAFVPGGDLTADSHRWDYRLHGILLQNPGLIDTYYDIPRPLSLEPSSSAYASCNQTGGDVFVLSDLRAIPQCVEAVGTKCQPGVVVDLVEVSNPKETLVIKQLIHVKLVGRVGSSWPIPENFWPTEELLLSKLPTRPSNPIIHASLSTDAPPKFLDCFPIDRYELEPSPFTQKLIDHGDASAVWSCVVPGSGPNCDAPFGYCKASPDLQAVFLYVLPYNYRELSDLLNELHEVNSMRMTDAWAAKLTNYLSNIPRYYYMPISKAFERLGFQGVIKPEALDRMLPYQLKNHLQKLRHSAKIEYDRFVHVVSSTEPPPLVKLPQSSLPVSMRPFSELRAFGTVAKPSGKFLYETPGSIPRRKLRKMLPKLRRNLVAILDGVSRPMDHEAIHNQALSDMGDYINYKFAQPQAAPLRELTPSPERLDTFGNPFRRKTAATFVADEVFVEDVAFSGPAFPGSSSSSMRRRSTGGLSGRVKGPLPPYITFSNWRRLSRGNSTASSSPQRDDFSSCSSPIHNGELNHVTPPTCHSPPTNDVWRGNADNKRLRLSSEDKNSFEVNNILVGKLIEMVRKPALDGCKVFDTLTRFVGSFQQKYASVSFVMAEALRFKQVELYRLLDEWRSCLDLPSESVVVHNNDSSAGRCRHLVNGLG
uniref:INT_SG_DDX_CT_C domain-containing protein n=1 Tax=Mesocestoides corti TaxID=53468 RepID=A0A5K3F9N2_MESCO